MHHVIDLHLEPHEASGLVCSRSDRLKERLGWSPLYWTILDDGRVDDGALRVDLHLLIGDLDSDPGTSRLLHHHPEAGGRESAHWTAPLPDLPAALDSDALDPAALEPVALEPEHQHTFTGLTRVEGIAGDNGAMLYVSDEGESVRMRFFTDDQPA